MNRYLFIVLAFFLISSSAWGATIVKIDHFTDINGSDSLGEREEIGWVDYRPGYAKMMSYGPPNNPVNSAITYKFNPSTVVVPFFRITAQNTQSGPTSYGQLSASINGGQKISYNLVGGSNNYSYYDFDFTPQFSNVPVPINELRVDWVRPIGESGARHFFIDAIDVHVVPEPSTIGFIGLLFGALLIKRNVKNITIRT
jgi:hypothetical protein